MTVPALALAAKVDEAWLKAVVVDDRLPELQKLALRLMTRSAFHTINIPVQKGKPRPDRGLPHHSSMTRATNA